MRILATILFFSITIAACSRKPYPQFLVTQVKDTTITHIQYSDTVVHVAAKSVMVTKSMPGDCPDFDTTVKKGSTTVNVSKKNGVLNVKCKEDSLNLVIEGLNKQVYQLRSITNDVPVPVYQDKPYIPKIVWWIIAVLASLVAWSYRKIFAKLFKLISGL